MTQAAFNELFAPIFVAAGLIAFAGLFIANKLADHGMPRLGFVMISSGLLILWNCWLWGPALLLWLGAFPY